MKFSFVDFNRLILKRSQRLCALFITSLLIPGCGYFMVDRYEPPQQKEPIPPSGNYVSVPLASNLTLKPFWVARYEMKNVNGQASSQPEGIPWVNIDRDSALSACQALGPGYTLITNRQWTAIANDLKGVEFNWQNQEVGGPGKLSYGHSDGEPEAPLSATLDENDACQGTGQSCSLTEWNDQRRVMKLSNGTYLWDFAGNVWEWVADKTIEDVDAANLLTLDFPEGQIKQSQSVGVKNLGAFLRGGCWVTGHSADLFTIYENSGSSDPDKSSEFGPAIGFRCVWVAP